MKSHASIKGHPIHPALVVFPVAFLVGAVVFDLLGKLLDRSPLWTTGGYLAYAGILTALLAAVPGLIDYLYTVPPRSSAKKRATLHMIVNLSAVLLFAAAVVVRGGAPVEPVITQQLMQAVALGLLSVGGWMGGELVAKNQIGVANRYANAGKWKEDVLHARGSEPLKVARADELKVNQMKLLRIDHERIVLARTEEGYVAFQDRCPHKGGSLAGGMLICGTVQCPWHGSQFDVTDHGALKAGPATVAIKVYEVTEKNDDVMLRVR